MRRPLPHLPDARLPPSQPLHSGGGRALEQLSKYHAPLPHRSASAPRLSLLQLRPPLPPPPFCQSLPRPCHALPLGLRAGSSHCLEGGSRLHLPRALVFWGSSRSGHLSSVLPPLGGARSSSLPLPAAPSAAVMRWCVGLSGGCLLPQAAWGGGRPLLYLLLSLQRAWHTVGVRYIKNK